MTRTNRFPLLLVLVAVFAWAGVSCRQFGPVPGSMLPPPRVQLGAMPEPAPQPPERPGGRSLQLTSWSSGGVAWRQAPPLRAAPLGLGAFLADVESRLPPE